MQPARLHGAALFEPLEPRLLLSGTTVYVDQAATSGLNNGSSWANAFTDLQPALTTAISGETFDVAQGTYKPTTGTDQTISFQLKDGVAIYGGFVGAANPTALRNVTAYPTILSGDIGLPKDIIDNSYHVVSANGVNATAILDGFTVTDGYASSGGTGGGMNNVSSSPTLTNCTFSENTARVSVSGSGGEGGGMYNSNSSPMLTNCIFSDNSGTQGAGIYDSNSSSPTLTDCTFSRNIAQVGGGMYNEASSSPTLTTCTFSGNSATSDGGGMLNRNTSSPMLTDCVFNSNNNSGMENDSSSPTLTNCTFSGNSSDGVGGGMENISSSPTLTNCTFTENSAVAAGGGMGNTLSSPTLTNCIFTDNSVGNSSDGGGGMCNADSSAPTLTNCTFSRNSASSGGGMENENFGSPTLTNCILWADSALTGSEIYNDNPGNGGAIVTYSDINGGFTGAGNINADPLFVNPAGGNLKLQVGSPAINVGDNAAVPAGVTTDLAGNPRIVGGAVDMGAFEFVGDHPPAITSAASATFAVGTAGQLVVSSTGFPTAGLTESGTLPSGIMFQDNGDGTATLSGMPGADAGGTYPLTFTANNEVSPSAIQTFTLSVDQALSISSANNTIFTAGSAGSFIVTTAGFPTTAITEVGRLPSGVTFQDNGNGTAMLSGTPAVGSDGNYFLTFSANNGTAPTATQVVTLTVDQAPAITSSAAATFTTGVAGAFIVTSNGLPFGAMAETGTLPSGVTFHDNGDGTATISGTPTTDGVYTLTLTAKNGFKPNAKQTFTLTVVEPPRFTLVVDRAGFVAGAAGTTIDFNATGFPVPALSESGILPAGVVFHDNGNDTGTLSGTPAQDAGGQYLVTVKAKTSGFPVARDTFTLTVDSPPVFNSASNATFAVGIAGNFTVTTTGLPIAKLTAKGLPAGVTFQDNGNGTGTLSGTPAAGPGGVYSVSFTARNGLLPNAKQSFALTVDQAATIYSRNNATFTVGTLGSFKIRTNGYPIAQLSEVGALPPGLSFRDDGNGTATIAGTPTAEILALYTLTLKAKSGILATARQAFTLTVES